MSSHIKACIFDMDGVICDTAKYHYLAWKSLAGALGINFTETHNEQLKGVSRMDSLEILLSLGDGQYTPAEKQDFCDSKNRRYVDYISRMDQSEILPGVLPFLNHCREQGIRTALGSVSRNAGMILKNLELKDYFDAVIDGSMVSKAKPDPEVFLKGAAAVGVPPENCVVFEDARTGIQAAKGAGMYAVGIGKPEILTEADMVIDGFGSISPSALLEHISENADGKGEL